MIHLTDITIAPPRKQCSQKHVKLALAFAQACQTTRGEMQCAYYN